MKKVALFTVCAALAAAPAFASANVLLNSNFELPTNADSANNTFPNWNEGDGSIVGTAGATAVVAATGITGTSARLVTDKGNFVQSVTPALSAFTFDVDFAMPDPGAPGNRGLNIFLTNSPGQGQINLRVVQGNAGKGTVQVFSTAAANWQTVLSNVVDYSAADLSTLAANHLTVTADYTGGTPAYTVNVNGTASNSLSFTQNFPTPTNLGTLTFSSDFSQVDYVIDNVSLTGTPVPEPATAGLLALATTGLLARRRRHAGR
jgi:hypothetical protein